jgi:septal ring factor EnvC (AmiA/AmiB activator)
MKRFFCVAAIFAGASFAGDQAWAGRPPEALLADKAAAEAEVHDLERRARALEEQSQERTERLKRRLRAIYKLSNGGSLRILSNAAGAEDFTARNDAIRRVLARDLGELAAVRDEAREVDAEQARRQDAVTRAVELDRQIASQPEPSGLAARLGRLTRPVPGPIQRSFGNYKEKGIEIERRGAEMEAQPGAPVRAVANAKVVWVGEAPGVGMAVGLDHGEGYVTLTGRIRPSVMVGELVIEGGTIGHAVGSAIYFELAQGGTPIDPAPWVKRPIQ